MAAADRISSAWISRVLEKNGYHMRGDPWAEERYSDDTTSPETPKSSRRYNSHPRWSRRHEQKAASGAGEARGDDAAQSPCGLP